jgi:hypothetical protein
MARRLYPIAAGAAPFVRATRLCTIGVGALETGALETGVIETGRGAGPS